MYESDFTKFMKQFMKEHPEEIESQRKGRSIWWDKAPAERTPPSLPARLRPAGGAEHVFRVPGDASEA